MASARVEKLLSEIARLSDGEQGELLNGLLEKRHRAVGSGRVSMDAVRQAVNTRERIRRRLADAGLAAGSISADLEEVREGRVAELLDNGAARDRAQ